LYRMDEHGHGRSGDGGEIIGDVMLTGVEGEDAYLSVFNALPPPPPPPPIPLAYPQIAPAPTNSFPLEESRTIYDPNEYLQNF
jgi:hypothetical protein